VIEQWISSPYTDMPARTLLVASREFLPLACSWDWEHVFLLPAAQTCDADQAAYFISKAIRKLALPHLPCQSTYIKAVVALHVPGHAGYTHATRLLTALFATELQEVCTSVLIFRHGEHAFSHQGRAHYQFAQSVRDQCKRWRSKFWYLPMLPILCLPSPNAPCDSRSCQQLTPDQLPIPLQKHLVRSTLGCQLSQIFDNLTLHWELSHPNAEEDATEYQRADRMFSLQSQLEQ
jgi:hypothetical protein